MEDFVLQLKDITKEFPGVKALNKMQFDLRRGSIHALIGENGAGKSTLMKVLSGIYTPEGGTIILARAQEVLEKEFPKLAEKIQLHIPDESSRRVGQSVAAASLPEL